MGGQGEGHPCSSPFYCSQSVLPVGRRQRGMEGVGGLGFQGGRRSETPPLRPVLRLKKNKLAGNLWSHPGRPRRSGQRVISGVALRATRGNQKEGPDPLR